MYKQHLHWRRSQRVILVAALAIVGLFSSVILQSCGNTLDSPEQALSQEGTSFFDQPFYDDDLAKRTDISVEETFVVSEVISAANGGVLLLGAAEGVSSEETESTNADLSEAFIILPSSFPYDTAFQIQVTKISTVDDESPIVYDFGPDGLVFSRPAILRVNAFADFGKNVTSVYLYWLNESTNSWEIQSEVPVDLTTGLAYFEIYHFSKYGTGAVPTSSGKRDL
jgi:hypothetical protein